MIYTTKENESFDAEILRQELVAAIGEKQGPHGCDWHIDTAGNSVVFYSNYVGTGQKEYEEPENLVEPVILAHFADGTKRDANKAILKQLAELEATQTLRRVREGGQWMIDLEVKIAALRGQLL